MKIEQLTEGAAPGRSRLARIHFGNGQTRLILLPVDGRELPSGDERFLSLGTSLEAKIEDPDDHIWGGGYPTVNPSMIPDLIRQLELGQGYPRFAVLMLLPKDSEDGEWVNLQYSWEDGKVGLDWVLLGGRNLADRDLVGALARHLGHEVQHLENNGVRYLRVEGPRIAELGLSILQEIYGIGESNEVRLLTHGI